MEQYDMNVNLVMEFLKSNGYSSSVVSLHRLCYKEFRKCLDETGIPYSSSQAQLWLESNKHKWSYRNYTSRRHCLYQLEDIYQSGAISPDHLGPHASAYSALIPELRREVDGFIENDRNAAADDRYRISCSRFLFFLQKHGVTNISQLDYDLLIRFHSDDYHRSSRSKDVYEGQIRVFLRYCSSKGLCSAGFSLALNKLLIHQIICFKDTAFPMDDTKQCMVTLNDIEIFLDLLRDIKYGPSVMKYSRHILSLLYIFLDLFLRNFSFIRS